MNANDDDDDDDDNNNNNNNNNNNKLKSADTSGVPGRCGMFSQLGLSAKERF